MKKNYQHEIHQTRKNRQSGNVIFTLFAAVAMVGVVGVGAMTAIKGPSRVISQVTQRTVVENDMLAGGKLALNSIRNQAAGGDCDGDGTPEAPAWVTAPGGTPFPVGGGIIPADIGAVRADAWKTIYGYCAWDHGTVKRGGVCASDNRLDGETDGSGIVVALISAGPDQIFQTSCADAAGGYVIRDNNSDDIVLTHNFADAKSLAGELWSLKSGDATTAQIDKNLAIKDSGGVVKAAIGKETGVGEFKELVAETIAGKSGEPVDINGAIKLADETKATDAACVTGAKGTLRYHATNGMQICNGTAYVAVTGGSSGGYNYGGQFEGKINAGNIYACGIRSDGDAYCWGQGTYGELGNGTTTNSSIPVLVSGGHKFIQVSTGYRQTCGLRTDGTAYCWGQNNYGQLGDGTTTNSSIPVAVSGGHKFVQIAVSNLSHACGLRTDGAVYCWGFNNSGKLGDGTSTDRSVPTVVTGGHKFVQIDTGKDHTCGIRTDGAAYCWGANLYGRLGDSTTTARTIPTPVSGGHKFVQINAGDFHTCGIRTDAAAYCWGINTNGQLGNGTTTDSPIPVAVSGSHTFVQINAGVDRTCGIRIDGAAYCWGNNGIFYLLGDGTTTNRSVPVSVLGGGQSTQISVSGSSNTCGMHSNGAAYCWGQNSTGQLGDGTTTSRTNPTPVVGFSMVDVQGRPYKFAQDSVACGAGRAGTVHYDSTNGLQLCDGTTYGPLFPAGGAGGQYDYNGLFEGKISSGGTSACGLRLDGAAYCWGWNNSGRLGDGTTTNSSVPVAVTGGNTFVQISSGSSHICGIRTDGAAYCWGFNSNSELGDGTTVSKSVPTAVSGSHKFVQISGGESHTCGIRTDGAAYCWGNNGQGNAGDGTTTNRTAPVAVTGGYKFAQISVADHSCAIRSDGAAYCWGYNATGSLGDGTTTARTSPVAVNGGYTFSQLSSGNLFTCAIRTDGATYCWGRNNMGQLGNGTTTDQLAPTAVSGGHKFVQISAGFQFTCGLRIDGTVYCWGQNSVGQLGDGTTTNSSVPVAVVGVGSFVQLSPIKGGTRMCGLRSNGAVYCWGNNQYGGLGDGTTTNSSTPVPVSTTSGFSMMDYQKRSFLFGNDATTCSSTNQGAMRYTGGTPKYDYCDGAAWVAIPAMTAVIPWNRYSIASNGTHSCGLRADGAAYCWGANFNGRLGDGTTVNKSVPTAVSGGLLFKQIVTGVGHTCGIRSDGTAYCWGFNTYGQLGDNTTVDKSVPTAVSGGHTFVQLTAGTSHTCGIRSDGTAYCWGRNSYGGIGDGTTGTNRLVPTAVSGSHIFRQINVGDGQTCGIKDNGAAYCWGLNDFGQLGDNTTVDKSVPTLVSGSHSFVQLALGYRFTCGIRSDSAAYCWGNNNGGALGDGTTVAKSVPTAVSGGHTFKQLSLDTKSCGIRTDGAAYCWGFGTYGGLGDGTTVSKSVPTAVSGGHTFVSIDGEGISGASTCAIRTDGAAYCWGYNNYGQLGDGTTTNSSIPVLVTAP